MNGMNGMNGMGGQGLNQEFVKEAKPFFDLTRFYTEAFWKLLFHDKLDEQEAKNIVKEVNDLSGSPGLGQLMLQYGQLSRGQNGFGGQGFGGQGFGGQGFGGQMGAGGFGGFGEGGFGGMQGGLQGQMGFGGMQGGGNGNCASNIEALKEINQEAQREQQLRQMED